MNSEIARHTLGAGSFGRTSLARRSTRRNERGFLSSDFFPPWGKCPTGRRQREREREKQKKDKKGDGNERRKSDRGRDERERERESRGNVGRMRKRKKTKREPGGINLLPAARGSGECAVSEKGTR